jgi:hypothetical protein
MYLRRDAAAVAEAAIRGVRTTRVSAIEGRGRHTPEPFGADLSPEGGIDFAGRNSGGLKEGCDVFRAAQAPPDVMGTCEVVVGFVERRHRVTSNSPTKQVGGQTHETLVDAT